RLAGRLGEQVEEFGVRVEFLVARCEYDQPARRPILIARNRKAVDAAVLQADLEGALAARQAEIDLRQEFRVKQRAVHLAMRVRHHEALAQRVEVVALAGELLLGQRERVDDAAAAVAKRATAEPREFRVDEAEV